MHGSDFVYEALVEAGVDLLVGLPGTQTLPLDRTIAHRTDIEYLMARHETAIPHIVWGYYEAGGGVAATLTVPGPGDTNMSHGLKNALDDGVPIIHISPDVDPAEVGKHPIHEIDPHTFDNVVKENIVVENRARLREAVNRGIMAALTPPMGPVRLGIPSSFLAEDVEAADVSVSPERIDYESDRAHSEAAALLATARRPVVYVGGGVRRSPGGSAAVEDLVEILDCPVAASFKGKGVFPEDDSRFLGVTGKDMPAGAKDVLEAADVVLALGTDFDGLNTCHWSLPMGETLIHVNIDPREINISYEADIGIVADVAETCEGLLSELSDRSVTSKWDGQQLASAVSEEYVDHLRETGLLDEGPPVSTPATMRTIRAATPDDTIVTTDVGGHRIWSKNTFAAFEQRSFVTPGSWAGMGVGLPSALGAKLANPNRPVLTLSGDGSFLMCSQELHTAAERDLDVSIVLCNDADYGVISKSPDLDWESDGRRFAWDSPDWVAIAEGYGCRARRARTRSEIQEVVTWALRIDGPTLVDVDIDPTEPTAVTVAEYDSDIDPYSY